MKKIPVMLAAGVMIFVLSSCGQAERVKDVQTDTGNNIAQIGEEVDETDLDGKEDSANKEAENNEESDNDEEAKHGGNDYSASTAEENFIDYEALGIREYEYPAEFSMGENLKTAVAQLALSYVSFDRDTPGTGGFKENFIAEFIQNTRLSFDYLDLISEKNNGQISIEELNYMQYSLTGTEVDFSSVVNGSIDRYEAASFYCSGAISGYGYEDTQDGVLITADLEVRYDGAEDVQKYKVTAELVRNPYSCFDGYSVAVLTSGLVADDAPENEALLSEEAKALYEGEYCDYDVDEPSLEIKRNE